MQIVPDEQTGDRLLAWVTNRNQTLVYNLRTHTLERTLATAAVKAVKKSLTDQRVYFNADDRLMSSIWINRPERRGASALHWNARQ